MFDQILKLVKDHFNQNPELTESIPADQTEDVHNEVATHLNDHLKAQSAASGGLGGLMGKLGNAFGSGSTVTNAISGGLVGSLASKFGLSPAVTGAITASLPAILQKFLHHYGDESATGATFDQASSKPM